MQQSRECDRRTRLESEKYQGAAPTEHINSRFCVTGTGDGPPMRLRKNEANLNTILITRNISTLGDIR
jgi:hypothetical protein